MSDYISKKNVREIILNQPSRYDMLENLKSAPSADVRENIHARWKRKIVDDGFNADWVCSNCGHRVYTDFVNYKFCPMCGAIMDGEVEPKGEKGE